jgi:hypothetical protein
MRIKFENLKWFTIGSLVGGILFITSNKGQPNEGNVMVNTALSGLSTKSLYLQHKNTKNLSPNEPHIEEEDKKDAIQASFFIKPSYSLMQAGR